MNVAIGELASTAATTATAITLTDTEGNEIKNQFYPAFILKVISGTIKMGVGGVHADAHGWTSSDTVPPVKCQNGNFYVQQNAAEDTFVITAC